MNFIIMVPRGQVSLTAQWKFKMHNIPGQRPFSIFFWIFTNSIANMGNISTSKKNHVRYFLVENFGYFNIKSLFIHSSLPMEWSKNLLYKIAPYGFNCYPPLIDIQRMKWIVLQLWFKIWEWIEQLNLRRSETQSNNDHNRRNKNSSRKDKKNIA